MKDLFFLSVGVIFLVGSVFLFLNKPAREEKIIKVGETEILVEVADNLLTRASGLSGRETLPEGRGMLFVFDKPGLHGFWMKGMKFPIDIIWLEGVDNSFRIIGIEKNVTPESFPQVFYPPIPVKYVVETNVGEL